jgi:4-hydroxy-L-threonine phosphate dehydrogenase PdxA
MSVVLKKLPYRVWVNQPSIYQPYHKHHGRIGLLVERENGEVIIYFFTNSLNSDTMSMHISLNAVSKSFV